jgi:DNA helicase HerA-like ATPase
LKQALQASYRARGIALEQMHTDGVIPGPSFSDVIDAIEGPANLRPRIDGLADLGLLRGGEGAGDLAALLGSGLVLSLHRVADQRLANALVELSLVVIHARLLAGEQPRRLTRLLVLDEAHRVARSEKLVALLREGRAFGMGAAVGTQYPGDLPDEVQGALATKLFLRNDQDAHVTAVARHLGASGSGLAMLKDKLRRLDRLEGMMVNAHHRPYARVRVLPHHARADRR